MASEVACGDEWLPGKGILCTLPKGHPSMHWAEYHIEYDKADVSGEGEIWWNGEKL